MTATLIDGTAIAEGIRARVADEAARLSREHRVVPGLAVVLVGDDPASAVYVRSKVRRTAEAGMRSFDHRLPGSVTEAELLHVIERLNGDSAVHAILVQLPLPRHIDASRIIAALDPAKDADGLHPMNAGLLAAGTATLIPCTPRGCVILARSVRPSLAGAEAVVIGRSAIVGKPLAQLLLAADVPAVCRRADLLFAAVGRPDMVRGSWIKPGAVVIDVGINRIAGSDRARLVGDVAFAEAREVAGAMTPVPGGVGPMTIACLLVNALNAARASVKLPPLDFT